MADVNDREPGSRSSKPKANLKVNAPTKKASKVKVESIQDHSDPEEFNHVTSVNGKTKRQRKKKSNVSGYNGKEALSPSERFYRDQIKAINNNPTQNGCNNFDAKIDDAWNKVTQVRTIFTYATHLDGTTPPPPGTEILIKKRLLEGKLLFPLSRGLKILKKKIFNPPNGANISFSLH